MRPRRAPCPPDRTELLPLNDPVADFHVEPLAMEESARQPHAMVDDQQIALKGEWGGGSEHDNPVGGCDERCSGRHRNVGAAVIGAGLALINTLRAEEARQAAGDWPAELLTPAVGYDLHVARRGDLGELGRPAPFEIGVARRAAPIRRVDMLQPPASGRNHDGAFDRAPVAQRRNEPRAGRSVAVESDQEAAIGRDGNCLAEVDCSLHIAGNTTA